MPQRIKIGRPGSDGGNVLHLARSGGTPGIQIEVGGGFGFKGVRGAEVGRRFDELPFLLVDEEPQADGGNQEFLPTSYLVVEVRLLDRFASPPLYSIRKKPSSKAGSSW
jgi:hypothetical protein